MKEKTIMNNTIMNICDRKDCQYNKNKKCACLWIYIDSIGKCGNFRIKNTTNTGEQQ